jgi:hypothetical protein
LLSICTSSIFLGDTTSMSVEESVAIGAGNNYMKVANAHWPLAYSIQLPRPDQSSLQSYGFSSAHAAPRPWWSHRLYRGPGGKEVEVLYSRDKATSEIVARQFLSEPVVGFDMEWPWNDWKKNDLQNKIGLIQIASERKIALFHIGLHQGKTTDGKEAPMYEQHVRHTLTSYTKFRHHCADVKTPSRGSGHRESWSQRVEGRLCEIESVLRTPTKRSH